jgi:tRNA uridine 5-carboxymethylaminomethyl modification enzyme
MRLTEKGFDIELISQQRYEELVKYKENINALDSLLQTINITPQEWEIIVEKQNESPIDESKKINGLLKRPGIGLDSLFYISKVKDLLKSFPQRELQQAEILTKYEEYFAKERMLVDKFIELENINIPDDFNYNSIKALSNEGREKLNRLRPTTLGQATRISGVSQTDIAILMLYVK